MLLLLVVCAVKGAIDEASMWLINFVDLLLAVFLTLRFWAVRC